MSRAIEVLLVEDNPEDVILVEEALREGKVAVNLSVVEDGVEAMQFLRGQGSFAPAKKVDLVILDLNLPKENGHEVLKKIKTDPDLKQLPVVVLTTSQAEKDVAASYGLGASCFITKPFGFYQFMEAVKSIEKFWFNLVTLPPK